MVVNANPLPDVEDDTKEVHNNILSDDDPGGSSDSESEEETGVSKVASSENNFAKKVFPAVRNTNIHTDHPMSATSADQFPSTETHGDAKTFESHVTVKRPVEETHNHKQEVSLTKDRHDKTVLNNDKQSGTDNDDLRRLITSTVKNVIQSNKPEQWKCIDCVIVFDQRDYEVVLHFKKFIEDVMRTEHEPIRVELFESQVFVQSKVRNVEDIISKCSIIFVFLTDHTNTPYINFFCEEAIGRLYLDPCNQSEFASAFALDTPSRCLLTPVHTKPRSLRTYSVPPGLYSLNGLDWFDRTSSFTRDKLISIMKSAKKLRKRHETEVNTKRDFQHIHREQQTAKMPVSSHTPNFKCASEYVPIMSYNTRPPPLAPYYENQHVYLDTKPTFNTAQNDEMVTHSRMLQYESDDHMHRHNIHANPDINNVIHPHVTVQPANKGGYQQGQYNEAISFHEYYQEQPIRSRTTVNNDVNHYSYAYKDTSPQHVLPQQNISQAANGRQYQHAFPIPTTNTIPRATPGQQFGGQSRREYPADVSYKQRYQRDSANFYPNIQSQPPQLQYNVPSHGSATGNPHGSRQYQPQYSVTSHDGASSNPHSSSREHQPVYHATGQSDATRDPHSGRQQQPVYGTTSHNGTTSSLHSSRQFSSLHDDTHDTPLTPELTVVSKITGKLIINPELSTDDVEIDTRHSLRLNDTATADKCNSESETVETNEDDYMTDDQPSDSSTSESDSDDESFIQYFNNPKDGKTVNIVGSSIVQIGSNNSVSRKTICKQKSDLKKQDEASSSAKVNDNDNECWNKKGKNTAEEVSNRPMSLNIHNDISNSNVCRGTDSENNYLDVNLDNTTNAHSVFCSNIHMDDYISESDLFSDDSSISKPTFQFNRINNPYMKSGSLVHGIAQGPLARIKIASVCQLNTESEVD